MLRSLSHPTRMSRSIAGGCCALAIAVLASGSRASAQAPAVFLMQSALQTFAPGHTARVIVSELGTARSRVFVEVRNRRNEVVARDNGDLGPRLSFVLDFAVPNGDPRLLKTTVSVVTSTPQTANPATTLEDIAPTDLKVEPRGGCALRWIPRDTPQTDCVPCPGWTAGTSFVATP